MSFRLQHLPDFRVVKELAVEYAPDGTVLVGDWLASVGEAENGQPAVGQCQLRYVEVAVLVGSAMDDGIGHSPYERRGWVAAVRQIDDPCDPAHRHPGLGPQHAAFTGAARSLVT